MPVSAAGASAAVTWTSDDGAHRLETRPAKTLSATDTSTTDATINVDPAATYQEILGQGQSLESSSVANMIGLSPEKREQLLKQLFDPATGNGYSIIRLAMGCPDFCSQEFYTYDDVPAGQTDESLSSFSIQKDIDSGIIALAQRAKQINPAITFYLSMWSAPAWMKTNGSLSNGGSVKPEYYDELARYQRMAIQAYEAQGIPITAMTPQNEPRVITNYPTGEWTGEQMRDYVRDHLGPELQHSGLATEIWVGDDNPPRLKDFVPAILDDPRAAQYVDGVAIHDYSGDDPTVLSEFSVKYPGIPLHLTERTYYGVTGERNKVDGSQQAGVTRVMDFYRNGLASWTYWLSFFDTAGEPNTGPLRAECCAIPVTAEPGALDAYTLNRDYYLYGQFSRFVTPGSVRIGSDQTSKDVTNVAFRTPSGQVVVVVANAAASPRSVKVVSPDGVLTDTLPAAAVATYRWAGTTPQADARLGSFQLVNRAHSDLAVHTTRENYLRNPDARNAVATPTAWNLLEQRWSITSAGDGYYRVTSRSTPSTVLHTTGEHYRGNAALWNIASVSGALNWDEQLWRIEPAGDGYYRLVNKARATVLQVTGDAYSEASAARELVGSPAGWNTTEQQFRLVPVA
ncbi:glycoside hydrolase family 30 beta sandwich domain-containing protein [Rathayibacter sp. VKM Ac-2857]|uniref:glycoside hydrolase family 30 beta sandwich domain-containing protein n=1 Tax=Rathayibacter sp. VKM Ac-2857 TaxID=2739020 RepID=UPI001565486D|nr:RICIN domain-containing protein [Rathayibacter sp. VKM Ac-2857]